VSYMQAEISGPETWLQIDGSNGTTNVPTDVVGLPDCPPAVGEWPVGEEISEDWITGRLEHTYPRTAGVRAERVWAEIVSAVGDYYDGPKDGIQSVQLVTGWGVRSQAPGYMDVTEWTVYTSEDEAREAYQAEREECGETDDEDDDNGDETDEPAAEFAPGTHALTTSPDELALCEQVKEDGPRSVALAALADWRTERDLEPPGSAVEFFAWMCGVGEPGSDDRLAHACDLAESERWGKRLVAGGDLLVGWEPDPDADAEATDDGYDYGPHESCIVYRRNPQFDELTEGDCGFRVYPNAPEWVACASLHGIDRPDDNYRRLVVAELFGELRADLRANPPARELIALIPADESL